MMWLQVASPFAGHQLDLIAYVFQQSQPASINIHLTYLQYAKDSVACNAADSPSVDPSQGVPHGNDNL